MFAIIQPRGHRKVCINTDFVAHITEVIDKNGNPECHIYIAAEWGNDRPVLYVVEKPLRQLLDSINIDAFET